MKKIDLIELDQFGNIAVSTTMTTNDIMSNKIKIDFGEFWYVFDGNGRLLQSNEIVKTTIAPSPENNGQYGEAELLAFLDGIHEGKLREHYGDSENFSPSDLLHYKNNRNNRNDD